MKIEKGYTIPYVVHAISVMDLELLRKILLQKATTVFERSKIGTYLFDFERIFSRSHFEDFRFQVVHRCCSKKKCLNYAYTFISNYSQRSFTLYFYELDNGMIEIHECKKIKTENQIRFSSFIGDDIEVPF